MRMFLVGMCDIFLILYLTTLGQIDEQALSPLTVSDYEQIQAELKASQESLKELEERLSKMAQSEGSSQEEKERLQKQIASLSASLEQEEKSQKKENASLEQELETLQKLLDREKKQREDELLALKKLQESKEKDAAKAEAELQALKKELLEKASLEKQLVRLQEEQKDLEEAAARAQKEKEKAEAEAKKRAAEAAQAKQLAEEATVAAREAKQLASTATGVALQNRVNAYLAGEDARRAEQEVIVAKEEVKQTREVIESITQESEEALEEKIKPGSLTLVWDLRKDNVLLGSSSYKKSLRLIPVRDGRSTIVVVPLEQLDIEFNESSDRYRRMNASILGQKIREVRVSPNAKLLAFVVPANVARSPREFLDSSNQQSLMPTLIALRNFSQLPFADRIRDVSEDFYVFNRDRLSREGGEYVYRARGVRGTGDYAGRILPGDTIVDLEGNVFGVAHDVNKVQAIRRTSLWKTVSLQQDPASVMKELKRYAGK